jgi:hypothetical protein
MAKNKLIVEYEYDFDLYGIISPSRDYKLAWLINQGLSIHLVKEADIEISFINNEKLVISNYLYKTEHTQLRLLKNKSEDRTTDKMNYLIPELNRFDYFIMKNGILDDHGDAELINQIQKIKEIQYITALDIKKLKSKENLIF